MVVAASLAGVSRAAASDLKIEWRGGAAIHAAKDVKELRTALGALAARDGESRLIVQFTRAPSMDDRRAVESAGLALLDSLGNHAWFANLRPGADLDRVAGLIGAGDVRPIETTHKLHPLILAGDIPAYAIQPPAVGGTEARAAVYVVFHRDVPARSVGRNVAANHGAEVVNALRTTNALVLEVPLSRVHALASEDGVGWVEPALPPLTGVNDSNRLLTQAEQVQQAPYELDGSGVKVLVFDAGSALSSHQDFGGRLTTRDNTQLSSHATHVSGTVGGDGSLSGGQYRGMAPGVTIESYGFEPAGGGIFLYTDPGDIEDDYNEAINVYGVDVANNSIGTNTATNGFPCEITGNYGVTDTVIDSIVRGGLGEPFRIVWANGNERQSPRCGNTYYTTAPPACAKNHITVGALNSNNDSMTGFSSWGPCDDGRLKPDVSAPGCQSSGDFGVTSTVPGGYSSFCGTSMASPTVCGLSALLLEDYRAQFPERVEPRNSTLKVLLAHTAEDRGNTGPDYQFGYGSVRIMEAVDHLRADDFYEDWMFPGGRSKFMVRVEPQDTELKVTLAWDDYPGTPNVNPALVNDLDLVVTSPGGQRYYPWMLNPADPAAPATRDREDHLNNIEQVYVENPEPGIWRVDLVGTDLPEWPQRASISASPRFSRDCDENDIPDEDQIAQDPSIDCTGDGIIDECEPDCDDDGEADSCELANGSLDCNVNLVPDECEVDCNENEIPDDCDIRDGTSPDCNANGVPDECDINGGGSEDCNENGYPDECDIREGRSDDFDRDGVPDECGEHRFIFVDDDAPSDPGPGDPDISDPDEDGSSEHPFDAVQEAVNAAITGDSVILLDGVYIGAGNRYIDPRGREIIIRGTSTPDRVVFDLQGAGTAFFLANGERPELRIENLTVRRGSAPNGGAIYCRGASPTIRNCVFEDNRATVAGGAIFATADARPIIANCRFLRNTGSGRGGAIAGAFEVSITIRDSLFAGNTTTTKGGAIHTGDGVVTLLNSTVVSNRATTCGGAVFCDFNGELITANSILWGNTAPSGSQIGMASPSSSASVAYCDAEGGRDAVDTNGGTLNWGPGNIDADPLFFDGDAGDYHVQADSPCINAADPAYTPVEGESDLDGDARIADNRLDIGVDEYGCEITNDVPRFHGCLTGPGGGVPSACECADTDGDDDVDLADFLVFQQTFTGE
jgi:predicted outer membrane repeat protein